MSDTTLLLLIALIIFFAVVPYSIQRVMWMRRHQQTDLSPELQDAIMMGIRSMVQQGKLQDAIKTYQAYKGVDLLTAKEVIVDIQRAQRGDSESSITSNAAGRIIGLVRQGKTDEAIAIYQKSTGSDLNTAKRAITQIQQTELNSL